MSDGDKGEAAEGIKLDGNRIIATKFYTEAEVKAMIAAALEEAAQKQDARCAYWVARLEGGLPKKSVAATQGRVAGHYAAAEDIRALIRPDAKDALDAYRDREVRKALEGAVEAIADYPRSSPDYDEWTRYDEQIEYSQGIIRALIPEVKS